MLGLPLFKLTSYIVPFFFGGLSASLNGIYIRKSRALLTKRLELQAAQSTAETTSRTKAKLLANTSHELRTPLNAIIGFSATLKAEVFGELANDKQREYIADIHDSSLHLLSLINDLLDASAIEAGKLELHETTVQVEEVLEATIRMVRPLAERQGVAIQTHISGDLPSLLADERRFKQIMLNLLSNAIKFTPKGKTISVEAQVNGNKILQTRVCDSGIGMTDEELKKALTPFGQVKGNGAGANEGTGLGLPLTVELVQAHGATLDIDSKKGVGTTATVSFSPERLTSVH